jgi:hypothetical protein
MLRAVFGDTSEARQTCIMCYNLRVITFFFVKMQLGTDVNISFVTVPIESLVNPLCVIPDSGGDRDIYFVVLPKRNWSQFFEERIIITNNI